MGPGQAAVVLTGTSGNSLCCCLILKLKVPVLQGSNAYKRLVLHPLMLDTYIKAITKNASGS